MKKFLFLLLISLSVICNAQLPGIIAAAGNSTSPYGPELVQDGGFPSATYWTLGANTSVTGGECVITGGTDFVVYAAQNISISATNTYKVEFDVTNYSAGTIYVLFGDWTNWNGPSSGYASNQHVNITIVLSNASAPADIWFYSAGDGFTGHIDNVSVKKVL